MPSVPVTITGVMTWSGSGNGRPPGEGGEPTHPIVLPPVSPPGYWGGAPIPTPTPPIYYPPSPPLGIWGGGGVPMPTPPIYYPPSGGSPPGYWGGVAPPFPTHPIAPGGPPPGYWGGAPLPWPTPPIAPGGPPPGIWPSPGVPTHPIAGVPGNESQPPLEVKVGWTPMTGWVVVLVPTGEATYPTPSATKVEVTKASGE